MLLVFGSPGVSGKKRAVVTLILDRILLLWIETLWPLDLCGNIHSYHAHHAEMRRRKGGWYKSKIEKGDTCLLKLNINWPTVSVSVSSITSLVALLKITSIHFLQLPTWWICIFKGGGKNPILYHLLHTRLIGFFLANKHNNNQTTSVSFQCWRGLKMLPLYALKRKNIVSCWIQLVVLLLDKIAKPVLLLFYE